MLRIVVFLLLIPAVLWGQTDTNQQEEPIFVDLSLAELLKVKIVSASQSEESIFDAPVSNCVITNLEIQTMGAASIPEALRICPGLLVREISNGTYDVSIRGGIDGLPAYNSSYISTSILVMIDNRPVFSSLQGGTFWQNLPIGVAQIDRIEVVYGPSAPLYGPNAVSGVINIISKKPGENNIYASGNVYVGNKTKMASVLAGAKITDKWAVDIAAQLEDRERYEKSYYLPRKQSYVSSLDSFSVTLRDEKALRFPDENRSLYRNSATANVYFTPSEKVAFLVSGSTNKNMGLMSLNSGTTIGNFSNNSNNILLKGNAYQFTFLASYLSGVQGLAGEVTRYHYKYDNTDLYLDYDWKLFSNKLSVRPAIGYQRAYANDMSYTVDIGESGVFNGKSAIENIAGSLKLDYKPSEKLRFIGAVRYDQFSLPNKGVYSYQFIVNYKPTEHLIFRALTGKSNNGSFLITRSNLTTGTGKVPNTHTNYLGNSDVSLTNNTMYEVGARLKISERIFVDAALFQQEFKDFSMLVLAPIEVTDASTGVIKTTFNQTNLPTSARQRGVTISSQISFLRNRVQFKPNITIQETYVYDFVKYYYQPGAYDSAYYAGYTQNSINDKQDKVFDGTPKVFGGFNLVINPFRKLFLNVSGYGYDVYRLHMNTEVNYGSGVVRDQQGSLIQGKMLFSINASYLFENKVSVFFNIKNISNRTAPEGFGSDRTGIQYGVGLNYNLN